MLRSFDRRVVPDAALEFVRSCQRIAPCRLGGGAALSGAYLAHRLSRDLDLVSHQREHVRTLADSLPDLARKSGSRWEVVRDGGSFVRGRLVGTVSILEVDLTYEGATDIAPPPAPIEGVTVESLEDLRASKLTCLLSRSEPRDLVDIHFLDRAGYAPERDFAPALQKDAGMDPGILAWLLRQFPVEPLPQMLVPLTATELTAFRDKLCERFRRMAVP